MYGRPTQMSRFWVKNLKNLFNSKKGLKFSRRFEARVECKREGQNSKMPNFGLKISQNQVLDIFESTIITLSTSRGALRKWLVFKSKI